MAKSTSRAKPKGKIEDDDGIPIPLADFIKSHVEHKLLRGGMDPDTVQKCIDQCDGESLAAVSHECGLDLSQNQESEQSDQDQNPDAEKAGAEEGAEQEPKKGMKALGDGTFLKLLWQNRDKIAQVVQKLVTLFSLKDNADTAGEDQSTRSSQANQNT